MKLEIPVEWTAACSGLQLGEDGIFYATASEAISYPEERNEACLAFD